MQFFRNKKQPKPSSKEAPEITPENSPELIGLASFDQPYEGLVEEGMEEIMDVICPTCIDTTHPGRLAVDGMCCATLMACSYPFEVAPAWLSDIISFGEGVEVSIFYEPLPRAKVIKELTQAIGITRSKKKSIGENQADIEIVQLSLDHAEYIREQLNRNHENFLYIYIIIQVFAETPEKLEDRLRAVEAKLGAKDILSRRADFRHEQGFLSSLPLCSLDPALKKQTRRNALTTGAASTYPFTSFEFSDENGIFVGINEHNNSLVIVDIFNTAVYKNANMVILGTSGAGKTFLMQLFALRLRMQGIQTMIIAPLKGFEFAPACRAIGGQYIKISPASPDCINIFEIRQSSYEAVYTNENDSVSITGRKEDSLLMAKIQKLHIFFSLLIPGMTPEEVQYLDEKLIEVYRQKGITFDNDSLLDTGFSLDFLSVKPKFKPMPVLGDLYALLENDPNTQRLAILMKKLVSGSLKAFNQQTNVDLTSKYIVADISDLKGDILPVGMFIVLELFWDRIKEDRSEKKAVFLDEIWTLIGSAANRQTAEFVLEIFKIIRGYGGAAIGCTQDINDFFALDGGRYGKGIINNSKLKVILQLEEEEAQTLQKVLKLTEEEMTKVTSFPRGHGLFYAGSNHVAMEFLASKAEESFICSDVNKLNALKYSGIVAQDTGGI